MRYLVPNLILFKISRISQLIFQDPLYSTSSDVIPFIVDIYFRNQKKWNHHVSVEICILLSPFFISFVERRQLLRPDPPACSCEGEEIFILSVSFSISLVA